MFLTSIPRRTRRRRMERVIQTGNRLGMWLDRGSSRPSCCPRTRIAGTKPRAADVAVRASSQSGFTMIELMIVMFLISIAVPLYQRALLRSKETILKNNLFTMRVVIDEYTYDKQKAPQTLQDLVTEGYLREVPMDPIVGNNTSWRVIMEPAMQ